MLVYCAQNTLTGKRYIGITTVSLGARWRQHLGAAKGGKTTPLHRAIRKYGAEAFVVEVIAELAPGTDRRELFQLERDLIASEGTMAPAGYNVCPGGEGITSEGYPASVREKLSRAKLGKPLTKLTGRPLTTAHRAKLSAAAKEPNRLAASMARLDRTGTRQSDETKAKRLAHWTPERREQHGAKQRELKLAAYASGETVHPMKGNRHSDDSARKISRSLRRHHQAKRAAQAALLAGPPTGGMQ